MDRNELVGRVDLSQYREVKVPHKMKFAVGREDGRLITVVGGEVAYVSDAAAAQVASRLKIPSVYIEKCPPTIQAVNLNYWSDAEPVEVRALMDMTIEAPTVVGFVRAGAVDLLDMEQVVATIEDVLGPMPTLEYVRATGSLEHVSLSIVGPKEAQPKRGDIFRAGLSVDYSPIDRFGLKVSGFNYRLVCTNGAYAIEEAAVASRRHAPDNLYEWLREAATEVWEKADAQFERLSRAAEAALPAGHLGDVLADLYGEFSVPLAARERIQDYIMREGVETMYDVYNAITWVATHTPEIQDDPGLQYRLMTSAGNAASHSDLCGTCHRPR